MADIISEYKTICCNATIYIERKLCYRCSKCKDDVTLYILYLIQAI